MVQKAILQGKGSLLAKIDIKTAYRLVPVSPYQRHYLGKSWKNQTYVDRMLPIGLISAPKIFNGIADVLEWCISKGGVQYVCLDIFTVLGLPKNEQCAKSLHTPQKICWSAINTRETGRSG